MRITTNFLTEEEFRGQYPGFHSKVIMCIAGRYSDLKGDIHNVAVFARVIRYKNA
jgi:hypothetical protein